MGPSFRNSLASSALLILAGCGPTSPLSSPAVVGGRAADPRTFVAQISAQASQEPFCGGTLVAPGAVVTAAHCVHNKALPLHVTLADGAQRRLEAVVVHPDYDPVGQQHDIALLFFRPAEEDRLAPILLNVDPTFPEREASVATVIGAGQISNFGSLTAEGWQEAELPLVALDRCRSLGRSYGGLTDDQICAGDIERGGADSCSGDSGGPLVAVDDRGTELLVGLVSWGSRCGEPGAPGVYTRVSSYASWVEETARHFRSSTTDLDGAALASLVSGFCHERLKGSSEEARDTVNLFIDHRFFPSGAFQMVQETPNFLQMWGSCRFQRDGESFEAWVAKDTNGRRLLVARVGGKHLWTSEARSRDTWTQGCLTPEGTLSLHYGGAVPMLVFNREVLVFDLEDAEPPLSGAVEYQCKTSSIAITLVEEKETGSGPPGVPRRWLRIEHTAPDSGARTYRLSLPALIEAMGRVRVELVPDGPREGRLVVRNETAHPIISWDLACSVPFVLRDFLGNRFASVSSRVGRHALAFRYPRSAHGIIPAHGSVDFSFLSSESVTSPSFRGSCSINSQPVGLRITPLPPRTHE